MPDVIEFMVRVSGLRWLSVLIVFFSSSVFSQIPEGSWRAALSINDTLELPFTFTSYGSKIVIHNAEENISVDEITISGDSIIIQMPVFDSRFHCRLEGNRLNGYFYNYARKSSNVIPFHAYVGLSYRFWDRPEKTSEDVSGRFQVIFDGEDEESKYAVGVFEQNGNRVTGTFLTTTGDYRFLEGQVGGKTLWLSAFDGSHLFMFTATIKGDSLVNGHFFSGKHFHDTWKGVRNRYASLRSADSLTALLPGYEKFDFRFPDENGKLVSLSDEAYKDKAVVVQIMGTWCPNCMDETQFLSGWYNEERKPGIEVIALDYERITDTATVNRNIRRLKTKFNVQYPILFAGSADKKEASKTLPMLNRVFAFPTTIFLDKDKRPVKIHTGFTGPAAGTEYEYFLKWFRSLTDKLAR